MDLDFDAQEDLAPVEIPVTYQGKRYILREATEQGACQYRNALLKATKMALDGTALRVTSVEGMADTEPLLVSLCLYKAGKDGGLPLNNLGLPDAKELVPQDMIRGWPARIVRRLFDKTKEISQLDEPETPDVLQKRIASDQARLQALQKGPPEDPAKNGLSGGATTSA